MERVFIKERTKAAPSGWAVFFLLLAALLGTVTCIVLMAVATGMREYRTWAIDSRPALFVFLILAVALEVFLMVGLFIVNPNEAKVLQLFGAYAGTVRTPGLRWANPLYSKKTVSVRIRNFESSKLKVNDRDGNPIEIAAVIVWRVVDTAEASFEVDNYENYVHVQSESAIRNMTSRYSYDSHDDVELSLRGNPTEILEHLKTEIQERLAKAGVEVIEARISHLAYAPEIAQVMLRRQQASAIIAARAKIVEGAVSMVQMALEMLARGKIVELDEDRKAAMVSNLMVVLCGDRETQPVVNTGTIYQ
jgi:regulator of protease activity HflC (stomatin/prohibitin superfamily)